jgi:hypothetical protein
VQRRSADELFVIGALAERADGRFADDREGLRKQLVQTRAVLVALLQAVEALPEFDV